MATISRTTQIEELNIFNVANNGGTVEIIENEVRRMPGKQFPIVAMVGFGEAKSLSNDFKLRWKVKQDLNTEITLTAPMDAVTTVLTASANDCASVAVNQTLYLDTEWVRVTDHLSTTTLQVERDFAGSTAAAHASGATAKIGLPAYQDGEEFKEGPKDYGDDLYNHPMMSAWELSEDALRVSLHPGQQAEGKDELAGHLKALRTRAMKEMEIQLLYGMRQDWGSSGNYRGSFGGIKSFIQEDGNLTAITGPLTPTAIIDMLQTIWLKWGTVDGYTIVGSPNSARTWDAIWLEQFGKVGDTTTRNLNITMQSIETRYGSINFTTAPSVNDGELWFLKLGGMKLHPIDLGSFGTGWIEFKQGTEILHRRAKREGFAWAGTFKMDDPREHGLITFTQAYGSQFYANYY